jgi:protein-S-isoprenylcysteine O-methyltransferase Ste14
MQLVDRVAGTGDLNQKMGDVPLKDGQKKPVPIPTLLLIGLFIISIFIPLWLGTLWFYSGLTVFFIGVVVFLSAILTAAKAPPGQVFSAGMYRYSRHPLYLSFIIIFLGISIASASWLYLILSMAWVAIPVSQVGAEEHMCLETFGVEYRQYMQRTPKWLGFPKHRSSDER